LTWVTAIDGSYPSKTGEIGFNAQLTAGISAVGFGQRELLRGPVWALLRRLPPNCSGALLRSPRPGRVTLLAAGPHLFPVTVVPTHTGEGTSMDYARTSVASGSCRFVRRHFTIGVTVVSAIRREVRWHASSRARRWYQGRFGRHHCPRGRSAHIQLGHRSFDKQSGRR